MTTLARALAVVGALCLYAPTGLAYSIHGPIAKANVNYNTVVVRGHTASAQALIDAFEAQSAGIKACMLKTLGPKYAMSDAGGMAGRPLEGEFHGPLLAFKLHQLPGGAATAEVLWEESPRIRPCLVDALKTAKLPATATEAVLIGEYHLMHKRLEPQVSGFSGGASIPSKTTVADLKAVTSPWTLTIGTPAKLSGKLNADALTSALEGSSAKAARCFFKKTGTSAAVTVLVTTNRKGHVNSAKAVGKPTLNAKRFTCVVDGLTHDARFAGRGEGRGGGGFGGRSRPQKDLEGSAEVKLTFSPPPKPLKVR